MMIIGFTLAILFALCLVYFGIGTMAVMIYETLCWIIEKSKKILKKLLTN